MARLSGGANIFKRSVETGGETLIAIVAGEASADLHGANLVRAISQLHPEAQFIGLGGPRMEAQGVKTLVPARDTAVVGLSEVAAKLGNIVKAYILLSRMLKQSKPSLLILIDFPEFNLKMASKAKKLGIPVMYYISPQVWAWRPGRVKKIASVVDRMVCILPFEEKFYRDRGVAVDYVGHPILDAIPSEVPSHEIRQRFGLEGAYPVIGIAPGSRDHEVSSLLPVMMAAAQRLAERYNGLTCLLPLAPTIEEEKIKAMVARAAVPTRICRENIYEVFSCCNCAMVASGTATLECAIMEVPMVVAYKVSPMSFFLAKRLVKVDHICLVNLVAGEEVVPELIQDEITPEGLEKHIVTLLEDELERSRVVQGLRKVKELLGGGGASRRAAEIAITLINPSQRPD